MRPKAEEAGARIRAALDAEAETKAAELEEAMARLPGPPPFAWQPPDAPEPPYSPAALIAERGERHAEKVDAALDGLAG